MKFYDRKQELELLHSIKMRSASDAQMTVVVGRRRTGKTMLLRKAIEGDPSALYLFITRKSEVLICEEFKEEIERKLNVNIIGSLTRFKDLFLYLMELSKSRNFTLIIDEFQEFNMVNQSVFSEMQSVWDMNKDKSMINLILCGSVYSLMKRIFEHSKEPLFARATNRIHLKPFRIEALKEILADNHPRYKPEDLLAFYLFTGGVAKYVELLISKRAFTLTRMLDEIIMDQSLFIDEGRNVLIEEFGKDYVTYFSILSLIASSKTSRSEIESVLEVSVGVYLERLENDFNQVKKVRPMFSKPGGRTIKYEIADNFLNFWFRFMYKHRSALEIGNFEYLKMIVRRDYQTYSGKILERYFREILEDSRKFSAIGTYWERGNKNEIDIVALNEIEKRILFIEVKRKKENISALQLQQKSINLKASLPEYTAEYQMLSLEDM